MLALPAPRDDRARGPALAIVQRWLVGLRWVAFALLALTLPVNQQLFGFRVYYAVALPVVALAAIVNVLAGRVLAPAKQGDSAAPGHALRAGPRTVAAFVAFDLIAIGIVLAASGGAANPFSALFLVHVALAAAVLPASTTFALSALAAGVFASLFAVPAGSCCAAHERDGSFSAHLYGMWMAFVLCAGLVAFFVTRIRRALEARDAEVTRLRRDAEHASRFASLGTLAAGTAHELGTPLGTIAVLAGEIAGGDLPPSEARAHAKAIASAVVRCRDVISKMQAAAHASRALAEPVEIATAVASAVDAFRAANPGVRVTFDRAADDVWSPIGADDFASALSVLLDNAAFATKRAGVTAPLLVRAESSADRVHVIVEDAGTGIPEDMIDRLGEPFLTTKEPGEGMGLGLYLARGLLEPAGGRLRIENRVTRSAGVSQRSSSVSSPLASAPSPLASAPIGCRATLDLPVVSAPAASAASGLRPPAAAARAAPLLAPSTSSELEWPAQAAE